MWAAVQTGSQGLYLIGQRHFVRHAWRKSPQSRKLRPRLPCVGGAHDYALQQRAKKAPSVGPPKFLRRRNALWVHVPRPVLTPKALYKEIGQPRRHTESERLQFRRFAIQLPIKIAAPVAVFGAGNLTAAVLFGGFLVILFIVLTRFATHSPTAAEKR